jgi:hypothetical protein
MVDKILKMSLPYSENKNSNNHKSETPLNKNPHGVIETNFYPPFMYYPYHQIPYAYPPPHFQHYPPFPHPVPMMNPMYPPQSEKTNFLWERNKNENHFSQFYPPPQTIPSPNFILSTSITEKIKKDPLVNSSPHSINNMNFSLPLNNPEGMVKNEDLKTLPNSYSNNQFYPGGIIHNLGSNKISDKIMEKEIVGIPNREKEINTAFSHLNSDLILQNYFSSRNPSFFKQFSNDEYAGYSNLNINSNDDKNK